MLIDLAICGIVAFCAWRGYKNGLIRGVFGIVSLVIALIVANSAAQAYSKEAKPILMPFASGIVDSTLSEMEENNIFYIPGAYDHENTSATFGEAFMVLRELGLPESAAETIANIVSEDPDSAADSYAFIDSVAENLTDALSYVAVFGITFLLLAIVFAVIGNLIGFIFALPGLKLLDMISGAVLGLVKGAIIVLALAFIIRYFGILALPTLESTTLLNRLVTNNMIADIFGL